MSHFFTLAYYLEVLPSSDFQYSWLSAFLVSSFFAAALVLHWVRKHKVSDPVAKKLLRRYPSRLVAFGSTLLFLWLCREGSLPYLSMHLWWLLLALYFIYWVLSSFFAYRRDYAKRSEDHKKSSVRSKYLPKKKR
ncbi:hypothetical protein IPJ72_03280 [Candidatus Peregrinibacteria bacterium]|nr:MAG: hypothetical protein IPJ72_03280 [Candidatus Peregrinibacteria bacterium]